LLSDLVLLFGEKENTVKSVDKKHFKYQLV